MTTIWNSGTPDLGLLELLAQQDGATRVGTADGQNVQVDLDALMAAIIILQAGGSGVAFGGGVPFSAAMSVNVTGLPAASIAPGFCISLFITSPVTGPATLQVNGLPSTPAIITNLGAALTNNGLLTSQLVLLQLDPNGVWEVLSQTNTINAATAQAALDAAAQATLAAGSATAAANSATLAYNYSQSVALVRGFYPSTAAALGNGISTTTALVAGSGGANGTFPISVSGGTQVLAPAGTFTVVGGALVNVNITYPGYYSAGTPVFSFAASAGLTGASAVAVMSANVPVNQYFAVPVPNNTTYASLYRVDAGPVATFLTTYPSTGALQTRTLIAPQKTADEYAIVFSDGLNNAAGGIRSDGSFDVPTFHANTTNTEDLGAAGYRQKSQINSGMAWSIVDINGRAALGVDSVGNTLAGSLTTPALSATAISAKTIGATDVAVKLGLQGSQNLALPEVCGIISYGQSNSVLGAVVNVQPYDNLCYNGGVYWQASGLSDPAAHASLVAINSVAGLGKPQTEGWSEYLKELLLSENGLATTDIAYQLLASADGQGATAIAGLSKGTTPYNRIITDATYGTSLAQAAGKTYQLGAYSWYQGESDTTADQIANYSNAMTKLVSDLTADIKAITGQPADPICISWQVDGIYPQIAFQQVAVSDTIKNMFISTPKYWFETRGDDLHISDVGYTKLGAYTALVHKRVAIDGVGWQPLRPVGVIRQGNILIIRFNNVVGTKLVLDTTTISQATNYGFTLFDAANASIAINSVTLTGPNTLKIVAATALPAGGHVEYGTVATTPIGNEFSRRGNLRNNIGLTRIYNAGGNNYPMHDWSIIFSQGF